jgi:hypothetical protein
MQFTFFSLTNVFPRLLRLCSDYVVFLFYAVITVVFNLKFSLKSL